MRSFRSAAAAGLLVVEAGLGVVGVLAHYGLTAEYGDVTASATAAWTASLTGGLGRVALSVLGLAAVTVVVVSTRSWVRLAALAVPALMALGMLAVTPTALGQKLERQYDAAPRCLSQEDRGDGPGARAARTSQRAFGTVEHVGHFSRGGSSGVAGCDRSFVLVEEVDVLAHYRQALPAAGWRVVVDRAGHLRAVRGDMALEVTVCAASEVRGGVLWAGPREARGAGDGSRGCP